MSDPLAARIESQLAAPVHPAVTAFAESLAQKSRAAAVLFYGSNLRTGSLDGVLDFYVLLPDMAGKEPRIWPRISYHERAMEGADLRAKVATMQLSTFRKAASGAFKDTTIWARFVQPSALAWSADDDAAGQVHDCIALAAVTAGRLAAALGPARGAANDYWRALFRATYKAEFRVEKPGRENDILSVNADHFEGLLPLAWERAGIAFAAQGSTLEPQISATERRAIKTWWRPRQRLGKPFNLVRLVKASTTFQGAARYAAWKIERHTGMPVVVTPFRERYPLLAAPGVLWSLWRHRRRANGA